MLHLNGHAKTRLGIINISLCFWVAKEDKHRVSNEFVDGATVSKGDSRHLRKICVEELRNLLWLERFGDARKILYVREKDRKLFSLSVNGDIFLSAENTSVDLGR